jgi:N-[(2S)-2-amino-2-carboxyethyl]-L-glutamate dehydrogenase
MSPTRPGSGTTRWVLHVSLRDLSPQIVLGSTNIVDDVEHCLKADTSPHLAEQLTGNRDFVHGTLDDVMSGRVDPPADRPVVFSPTAELQRRIGCPWW